jgi:CDP-glycerol glycerophosphotransferase
VSPAAHAAVPAPADALLTVVVAVYDVEPYLQECLDSVARCVPDGTEVVLVDDGSHDRSGEICDAAAEGRRTWRVVHQANAGLGAARNTGLDLATGEFVGFVDSDDILLPAYATLVRRAAEDGTDVATGAVLRTDGRTDRPSGLHDQALQGVGEVGVLVDDPSLLYDTTAWNKVYRRSFLQKHGLRFPEGVLYEDLPVTVPALHLAGRVSVVHEPVYRWRAREGDASITQRRHELANLTDRFAAVSAVDGFLEQQHLDDLRVHHDIKVLRLDLPLYTSALPEADAEYRAAYLTFFRHLVDGLPPERRAALPPTLRLYVELADAGRMDDLIRVVRARRGPRAWARDDRGRLARVRDNLASFRVERGLGLSGDRQLARRVVTSTAKILLPRGAPRPSARRARGAG